jgi:hypothetical protein
MLPIFMKKPPAQSLPMTSEFNPRRASLIESTAS